MQLQTMMQPQSLKQNKLNQYFYIIPISYCQLTNLQAQYTHILSKFKSSICLLMNTPSFGTNPGYTVPSFYPTSSQPSQQPHQIFQAYNQKPYQNEQFLDRIFNFNDEYIRVYHTLPHQVKLKFYLSVEQQKMLGHMNDRKGYQDILKQIARRVMLLRDHPEQQPNQQQNKQDEKVIWGSKLENLCDNHLKKIQDPTDYTVQQPNRGSINDLSSNYQTYYHDANIVNQPNTNNQHQQNDQEFQWVDQNQPKQEINQFINNNTFSVENSNLQNGIINVNTPNKEANFQQQQDEWEWKQPQTASKPFNLMVEKPNDTQNNISNSYRIAKINQVAQKQEFVDIWELDINQEINQEKNQILQVLGASHKAIDNLNNHKVNPSQVVDQSTQKSPFSEYTSPQIQILDQYPINQPIQQTPAVPSTINKPNLTRKAASQCQFTKQIQNQHPRQQEIQMDLNISVKSTQFPKQKQYHFNDYDNNNVVGGFRNNEAPSRTTSGPSQNFDYQQDQFFSSNFESRPYQPEFAFSKNISIGESQAEDPNSKPSIEAKSDCVVQGEPIQTGYMNIGQQLNNQMNEDDQEQFQWQQNEADHQKQQLQQKKPTFQTIQQENQNQQIWDHYNSNGITFQAQPSQPSGTLYFNDEFIRSSNNTEEQQPPIQTQPAQTSKQASNNFAFDFQFLSLDNNNSSTQPLPQPSPQQTNQFPFQLHQSENSQKIDNNVFFQKNDDGFLDEFRVKIDTTLLQKSLLKKYIDFDRDFYDRALELIDALGYAANSDYQFIWKQRDVCCEIFRLTELKSSAVEEDEEYIVRDAINKTKALYSELDSDKTASILKKYLSMKGVCRKIKIGKLSLEAGISKELILKYINSQNAEEILSAQYCIQNLSSTRSMGILSGYVGEYLQEKFNEMNRLAEDLGQLPQKVQKQIRKSGRFLQYRKELVQIIRTCKNFLVIGKICMIQDSQLSSLQSQINQTIPQQPQQLVPSKFVDFYCQFACNPNTNIYSLFSEFRKFVNDNPVCSLCLKEIKENNPGGIPESEERPYHYHCWNLEKEIQKFKLQTLQEIPINEQPTQGQGENGEQQVKRIDQRMSEQKPNQDYLF